MGEALLPLLREGARGPGLQPARRPLAGGADRHTAGAGGAIVNVSSGLGSLSGQSSSYRKQVEQARSLADLRSIRYDASDRRQAGLWGPTYSLSKAMLNKATRQLAASEALQRRHVSVNVVDPGWCRRAPPPSPNRTLWSAGPCTAERRRVPGCRTDLGGRGAPRSAEQGAQSIVTTLLRCLEGDDPPSGQLFRDGKPLAW